MLNFFSPKLKTLRFIEWPLVACNKTRKGVFIFSSLYLSLSLYDDKFYFQFGGARKNRKKKFKRERVQKKKGRKLSACAAGWESSLLCVLVEYIDWRTGRPGEKKKKKKMLFFFSLKMSGI
jgi:hypothetical protein